MLDGPCVFCYLWIEELAPAVFAVDLVLGLVSRREAESV